MKNKIIVRLYNGIPDGYIWINSRNYTYNLEYATRFTSKQAARIVAALNKEMERNYSYYYRYEVQSCY